MVGVNLEPKNFLVLRVFLNLSMTISHTATICHNLVFNRRINIWLRIIFSLPPKFYSDLSDILKKMLLEEEKA